MRRRLTALVLAMMIAVTPLLLAGCDDGPVGFWKVDEVTAGDVTMTDEDAKSIGLNAVGTVKLQKSGNCVVVLLGEENEGTWAEADDGMITVEYGDEMVLTGSIDEDGVMTLSDDQGAEYKLSK